VKRTTGLPDPWCALLYARPFQVRDRAPFGDLGRADFADRYGFPPSVSGCSLFQGEVCFRSQQEFQAIPEEPREGNVAQALACPSNDGAVQVREDPRVRHEAGGTIEQGQVGQGPERAARPAGLRI
jgi:hypothetical protein